MTLRRFTQQALCGFGVGKTSLEEKIASEIHAASSVIDENASEPMDIRPIVQKITGNILYSIVFGKRFDFNDPDFEIINRMTNMGFHGGPLSLARYLPHWVTRIIAKSAHATFEAKGKKFERIVTYVNEQVKQHDETYNASNIRGFVDLFIEISRRPNTNEDEVFTKESMFQIIIELFLVGIETIYTTIDWAFLFMTELPEIQEKCFQEIKDHYENLPMQYTKIF